jgi:hypothetical protein
LSPPNFCFWPIIHRFYLNNKRLELILVVLNSYPQFYPQSALVSNFYPPWTYYCGYPHPRRGQKISTLMCGAGTDYSRMTCLMCKAIWWQSKVKETQIRTKIGVGGGRLIAVRGMCTKCTGSYVNWWWHKLTSEVIVSSTTSLPYSAENLAT